MQGATSNSRTPPLTEIFPKKNCSKMPKNDILCRKKPCFFVQKKSYGFGGYLYPLRTKSEKQQLTSTLVVFNLISIRGCNLPLSIKFPSSLLRKIWMLDTFQRGNILKTDFQFQFDLSPMFAEQLKHWNLDRW